MDPIAKVLLGFLLIGVLLILIEAYLWSLAPECDVRKFDVPALLGSYERSVLVCHKGDQLSVTPLW